MGGPLSVVFTGCFLNKMETEVVKPMKPKFYRRYVDDTYVRRKKLEHDVLFDRLNNFHPNIKLTIEVSPRRFLDTEITRGDDGKYTFGVVNKESKLPFHWSSKVPTQYKRSVIKGDLNRAKRIGTSINKEIDKIKAKYNKAGYPLKFVESQIRSFNMPHEESIIPSWLFEERRKVFVRIPYCPKNETKIGKVIERIEMFCNDKVQMIYIWKTSKIRSLFRLKDKIQHANNVIYKGECVCQKVYIGETKRNAITRWKEHNSNLEKSEPSKHLVANPTHEFKWSVIDRAPKDTRKRKILEAYHIMINKPSLNDQKDIKSLTLFRNGIT